MALGANDAAPVYLLADQLGPTSVLVSRTGQALTWQYDYPYGGNRGGAVSELTTVRYTGQRQEDGLPGGEGLYDYGARWYDARLARFNSPDSIVPNPGNPQALNRYAYAANNPLRYVDPSGFDPLNSDWETEFRNEHSGRGPTDDDRYLRLLSLIIAGSNSDGSWTASDFKTYYGLYNEAKAKPGTHTLGLATNTSANDLNGFVEHLRLLASHYSANETAQYVRAIALLWAGVRYSGPFEIAAAEITARNLLGGNVPLTPFPMLFEGASGWKPDFTEGPGDNPTHHYAMFLATGVFIPPSVLTLDISTRMNHARDSDNPADLRLGDTAIQQGRGLRGGRPGTLFYLPDWVGGAFVP